MPKNFFILGPQRSRSAWLSVFLTTANTYCYHEGMRLCENVEEWKLNMSRNDYTHVGDSDSGLINLDLGKFYPDAPIVIIERDIYEVSDSLINILGCNPGDILDRVSECRQRAYDATRHCNNVMTVEFNDINDKIEDIWKHCIGEGFDRNRAKHLIEMNIQTQYIKNEVI